MWTLAPSMANSINSECILEHSGMRLQYPKGYFALKDSPATKTKRWVRATLLDRDTSPPLLEEPLFGHPPQKVQVTRAQSSLRRISCLPRLHR